MPVLPRSAPLLLDSWLPNTCECISNLCAAVAPLRLTLTQVRSLMAVSFITGASSGIGRSLAKRLAANGDLVAVVARREILLDSLVTEIEAGGGKALAICCDVTNAADVAAAVQHAEKTLGPIDRLIANVGGGKRTHVDSFQTSHVSEVMTLNLVATSNCIEAVLPGMLGRGAGHIVATGSLASYRGLPQAAAYSAAKAAITNLMESLRIDLRPRGIYVTLLLPGFVRTSPLRKKSRPFEMELEDATEKMVRAIELRKRRCSFPVSLAILVGTGRLLPAALYDRLFTTFSKRSKKVQS